MEIFNLRMEITCGSVVDAERVAKYFVNHGVEATSREATVMVKRQGEMPELTKIIYMARETGRIDVYITKC